MNWLQGILIGLLIAWAGAQDVHAAGRGIDRATGQALWDAAVKGRTTTIGSNGAMKVISPAGTSSTVAGGATKVTGSGTVPVAEKQVPVGFTGEVAKEAIVGGLLGCARGGVVGCALGVGVPLATAYWGLSGARWKPETQTWELQDMTVCTMGPCYYWTEGHTPGVQVETQEAACQLYVAYIKSFRPTWDIEWHAGPTPTSCVGHNTKPDGTVDLGGVQNVGIARTTNTYPPKSPTWYPATEQQVKDALYKNDPAPGIVDELSKFGNIIWPLGNVQVTGPSEVKGPKKTTISQSGNRTDTTVSQESTPLSYSGPSVTAGNTTRTSTTTSVTTNPDGSTSTSTSTTTETTEQGTEGQPQEQQEEAPTDTALPPVPDLYTRKYPEGLVGIWNTKSAEIKQAPLFRLATDLMPHIGSGGSCPSWPINLDFASWAQFGTKDVAPPCETWDWARLFVIAGALLLARALIFGG